MIFVKEIDVITINTLNQLKQKKEKIAVLTSYDATFARVAEQAGVEVILVGDSLGMVVQGQESTVPVTVDDMVYHSSIVTRGTSNAFVIADMPFMSYATLEMALDNAARLMQEGGAHMVKLEGGGSATNNIVRELTSQSVPVCGHLGLLPQSVHQMGGYKVQGRDEQQAEQIMHQAIELQQAGAQMLVLECVPALLANRISEELMIPVIGIGAGKGTDGQVLVLHDMLGLNEKPASFVTDFLAAANGSIASAIEAYVQAVKQQQFPGEDQQF